MVLAESCLNSEKVSLMRPIYFEKCIFGTETSGLNILVRVVLTAELFTLYLISFCITITGDDYVTQCDKVPHHVHQIPPNMKTQPKFKVPVINGLPTNSGDCGMCTDSFICFIT